MFPGAYLKKKKEKKKNKNDNDKAHTNCKVSRSFIQETTGYSGKEQGWVLELECSRASVTVLNFLFIWSTRRSWLLGT